MTTTAPLMAEELMIGNYVLAPKSDEYDLRLCKIFEIRKKFFRVIELSTTLMFDQTRVKPIPLTEQWLKEFGFREHETIWWITIGKDKRIQFDGDGCMIEIINEFIRLKHIKYVHQLQNLYFCLCGTKLERGRV